MSAEQMSIETQQALLQYFEASKALRSSDTEEAAEKAAELLNQADTALWMLKQNPDTLRRRVEIVRKKTEERDSTIDAAAQGGKEG